MIARDKRLSAIIKSQLALALATALAAPRCLVDNLAISLSHLLDSHLILEFSSVRKVSVRSLHISIVVVIFVIFVEKDFKHVVE